MKKISRFSILINSIVLLLPLTVFASFNVWEPGNGSSVRQGFHIKWTETGIAKKSDGSWLLAWSDARNGSQDVYAQFYDSENQEQWNEEGLRIAENPRAEREPIVIEAVDGAWIIGWFGYYCGFGECNISELYLQRVSLEGELEWGQTGVRIVEAEGEQVIVKIIPAGDGGAIATWRSGEAIRGQRIDVNGERQWDEGGLILAEYSGVDYDLMAADNSNFFFNWRDFYDNQSVKIEKFNEDGQAVWNDGNGVAVSDTSQHQGFPSIVSDQDDGLIASWYEPDDGTLRIQHLDSNGDVLWDPNGFIFAYAEEQSEVVPKLKSNNDGEWIVVWRESEFFGMQWHIFAQKFSDTGDAPVLHWGPEGNETEGLEVFYVEEIVPISMDQNVLSDEDGGAFIYWSHEKSNQEYITANNYSHGLSYITSDGQLSWENPVLNEMHFSESPDPYAPVLLENQVRAYFHSYKQNNGISGLYFNDYTLDEGEEIFEELVIHRENLDGTAEASFIVMSDSSVYAGWIDHRFLIEGSPPMVQRLSLATGEPLWDDAGRVVVSGFEDEPAEHSRSVSDSLILVPDGMGGIISLWQSNTPEYMVRIYAQRLDSEGNRLWGEDGKVITPIIEGAPHRNHERPRALSTDDGGVFIAYTRMNEDWWQNVWIQSLDSDGNYSWESEDGFPVIESENDQYISNLEKLSDGSFLVLFHIVQGGSDYDLFASKIDASGDRIWDLPMPVCINDHRSFKAQVIEYGDDLLVVWADHSDDGTTIRMQMLSSEGLPYYDEDGVIIAEEVGARLEFRSAKGNDNSFWLAWESSDLESGVRFMQYDIEGQTLLEPAEGLIPGNGSLSSNNPRLISDNNGGVYLFWHQGDEWDEGELYYIHMQQDGQMASAQYEGQGVFLSNAWNNQQYLRVNPDGDNGVLATWMDYRSGASNQLSNIYAMRVNDYTVDIQDVETKYSLPSEWKLYPAYPNPFNSSIKISFETPGSSFTELSIYDILGRRVNRLVNRVIEQGYHEFTWDGTSATGLPVSSGTYIYRLKGNGFSGTNRIVHLK